MKQPSKNEAIAIFEGNQIRRHWDEEQALWYFSVVDVVRILTDSVEPRKYWNKLAQRLREEGSEVVTKCHQLKFMSKDGKFKRQHDQSRIGFEYACRGFNNRNL